MRRGWLASALAATVVGLGASLNAVESRAAADNLVLRLCYDDVDARPWRYKRGGGLDFQLLDRTARKAGISFEYEAMPWQNCVTRLHAGEVDGLFGDGAVLAAYSDLSRRTSRAPIAPFHLHPDGKRTSYLVLSREIVDRQPELTARIRQSIEAVRASAAYQVLERQTLGMLGKT